MSLSLCRVPGGALQRSCDFLHPPSHPKLMVTQGTLRRGAQAADDQSWVLESGPQRARAGDRRVSVRRPGSEEPRRNGAARTKASEWPGDDEEALGAGSERAGPAAPAPPAAARRRVWARRQRVCACASRTAAPPCCGAPRTSKTALIGGARGRV